MNKIIDKDSLTFVKDPNFVKFVELYFGKGAKVTYVRDWKSNSELGLEPILKIVYIHLPTGTTDFSKNQDILYKFIDLMREMKDYPINLVIDIMMSSQEDFINHELNKQSEVEKIL